MIFARKGGMDDLDRGILCQVRKDGRVHISRVARELERPVTTVFDRWKRATADVKKFVSLADFSKIGFAEWCWVRVPGECKGAIDVLPGANTVLRDASGYWVECCFRDEREVSEFKKRFRGAKLFRIDAELKREWTLTDESHFGRNG